MTGETPARNPLARPVASITIEVDPGKLASYTDQHLAVCWHVAQANPAPAMDRDAGDRPALAQVRAARAVAPPGPPLLLERAAQAGQVG